MNDDERVVEVRRWLRYAREDLHLAEVLIARVEGAPRHSCWLAQQAAEKALKAVLRDLIPEGWTVKQTAPDLAALTEWAVEARYPGDEPEPDETDAQEAVQQAQIVLTSIENDFPQHGFDVEGPS
jgi:HEPN domain-containing protein